MFQLISGIVLAFLVSYLSYRLRFLTRSGAFGSFLIGTIIFGLGGIKWVLPILLFFFSSSFLSSLGKKTKLKYKDSFEKTATRDIWQVLANGSMAALMVLLHFFFPSFIWYLLYLTSLAAVTADTWGTEIGILSKSQPVLITTFRKVSPGKSGGITFLGTSASFLGSLILASSGMIPYFSAYNINLKTVFLITLWGSLVSLLDSLLGATLQAQYLCPVCNKITERKKHCWGNRTTFYSGIFWINNDLVNFFCSLSAVSIITILI